MKYNYSKLQNGSDIRGVALPLIETEPVNLDEETITRLMKGFILLIMEKTNLRPNDISVAVGRDSRLSGKNIENIVVAVLKSLGVTVIDCNIASTPAMFMATIFDDFKANASIMITASHLPKNRNGFKFFDINGGFDKSDIKKIIGFAESECELSKLIVTNDGEVKEKDLIEAYSNHLQNIIRKGIDNGENPLEGIKITVDAGNGAGGFFATKVLEPLGADVSSSQFLEPDGNFPNHIPNPENKEAINSICERVKESKSDLGIIFDTDVDRCSAVDENGAEINRNKIVGLAASLVSKENKGTTIVTDSVTSKHLTEFIENELGLKHLRYKRGYKNVINKSIELCKDGIDSQIAIETSGHCAFKENYFLDDGAYLATKIVILTALLMRENKNISSKLEKLKDVIEEAEFRIPMLDEDFGILGDTILEDLEVAIKENEIVGATLEFPNYEGVRINFDKENGDGWALLRKSLHDPILPLNIESDSAGGVLIIQNKILNFLDEYAGLDLSKLIV